ncbi:MAG: hypothetical protein GX443_07385 [Deltaproteobacteria bacterium]|nr:hypothetical protein [Deltaproteobacteria bacterium]
MVGSSPSDSQRTCRANCLVGLGLLTAFFLLAETRLCRGDSAEVLPKGVARFGVESNFYFPITQRFNQNGDVEDVATDLNARLDSTVFPDLRLLEAFFALPAGFANIGRSEVSFEYRYTVTELSFQYGITGRLSAGIMLPYWFIRNEVQARLDTSGATVGKSALLGSLAPLGFLDTVPLSTRDAQNLIGKGLDIDGDGRTDITGFGFKPVRSWHDSGLSDIEAGLRLQYLNTPNWRLAVTGGVRFPTGEVDSPDDLADRPFGTGAWGLMFHLNNDFVGIKNLLLNFTFRYEPYLPHSQTLRILRSVNEPLSPVKAELDIDLGDVFELETSGTYTLPCGFSVSLMYRYGFSLEDAVTGPNGRRVTSLEEETAYTEHIAVTGLTYSTVPLYQAKKFPVPLTASITYRNRFAGLNNVLKSQYIGFILGVYF